MSWLKNRYNKKSANKHGWHPSWFAAYLTEFDTELIDEVIRFQVEHDLKPDGMVGPITFRRLLALRELLDDNFREKCIIINGEYVPIDWDVTIDLIKPGAFRKNKSTRRPNMIVTHWDACTSAKKCKYVLEARNISTHFCIDNDGVIYQYVDTNDTAWHAGGVNKRSIGIDISNAYYLKYNKLYQKKGFQPRPILTNSVVHGRKLKPHLGYYKIQIEAYKVLLKTLTEHYNIQLKTPDEAKVIKEAKRGKYNGVVCHYHVSRNKIDCAGLDLNKIIDELS